jgi:hypothetical protein
MNDRFEFFSRLPAELKGAISGVLPTAKASGLSITSKEMNCLSQCPPAVPMSLRKFLHHVVRGEHALMQNMLLFNIDLLWQRGIVTDCSGREFGSVSGFEYSLWSLDKHQWGDMLACLPRENTGQLTDKGRETVAQLLSQYMQIKTRGVTYRLNEMTKTESHYDFAIINALHVQVNAQNAPGNKNWDAINRQWREGVGGAQRLCPLHVVDEYCSNTPFYPVPQFDSRPQPANSLRRFYNWFSENLESWFGSQSRLGFDFAIYKAYLGTPQQQDPGSGRPFPAASNAWSAVHDLDAMRALCETRTLDCSELETQLHSLMAVEEHPRPGI